MGRSIKNPELVSESESSPEQHPGGGGMVSEWGSHNRGEGSKAHQDSRSDRRVGSMTSSSHRSARTA